MVHDMNRFILQSRSIVEQAPLQIYCSSLIFAPTRSIIRNQFKHYIPDWIRKLPKVQEDWSPLLQTLEGHGGGTNDVAFSVDGGMAASASNDHTIRLWDTVTGSAQGLLEGHTASVKAVSYSPDGRLLASGSNDCTVRLWNPNTGVECAVLRGHTTMINAIAFNSRGDSLASVSNDKSVRIWDTKTTSCRHSLLGHKNWVNDVTYSPDGATLATVAGDATIRLWNLESGELECRLRGSKGGMGWLNSVSVSRKGILAAGSANGNIYLWDMTKKAQIGVFYGHTSGVNVVSFSPDEDILVSGSNDCTVRLWNPSCYRAIATLERHAGAVMGVAVSAKESLIASVSADCTIRFWDYASQSASICLERQRAPVIAVAISPDGRWGASLGAHNTGNIWHLAGEAPLTVLGRKTIPLSPNIPWSPNIAFTSDSKQLLVTWSDPIVYHWEMADGSMWSNVGFVEGEVFAILHIVIAPNNQFLVSLSSDQVIRLWDIASGHVLMTFSRHREDFKALCFSHCSRYLAAASLDGSIHVWEVISGTLHTMLLGHKASVNAVRFSSNGHYLLSGSTDGTIRLWNIAKGQAEKIMRVHEMSVESVGFLDNDTLAYSTSGNGTNMIWKVDDGTLEQNILMPDLHSSFLSPAGKFVGWLSEGARVFRFRYRSGKNPQIWSKFLHFSLVSQPEIGELWYLNYENANSLRSTESLETRFISIIFSRDEKLVALAQSDGIIQILNTFFHQGCCVIDMSRQKIPGGPRRVDPSEPSEFSHMNIKFAPSGDRLACALQVFIYIWDSRTGDHHHTLAHKTTVKRISFSPDGDQVVSTLEDGIIWLWELASGTLRNTMVVNGSQSAAFLGNGFLGPSSHNRHLTEKRQKTSLNSVSRQPLVVSNPWIKYRAQDLIWLPVEYRATCFAVNKDTLVIGHGSGESTTIEFDVDRITDCFSAND